MRENDIGLVPPEEKDPLLPEVRVAGFKLTSILLLGAFVAGAFFALRFFIQYSTDEVTRAKTEVHEAFTN